MTNRFYFMTGFVIVFLLLASTLSTDIIVRYADHLSLLVFLPSAGIGCYCVINYLYGYYISTRQHSASQQEIQSVLRQLQVKGVQFKAVFNGNTALLIPNNLAFHQTATSTHHHSVYVLKLTMDERRKIIHYDDRYMRTQDAITIELLERCFDEPVHCIYSKFNLTNHQATSSSLSSHLVRQQLNVDIHTHGWSLSD